MGAAADLVIGSAGESDSSGSVLGVTASAVANGTVECSRIGVIWSFSDVTDGSAFQAAFNRAGTSCIATTTSAEGTTISGTFSGSYSGISGPRANQTLEIANGTFTMTNVP